MCHHFRHDGTSALDLTTPSIFLSALHRLRMDRHLLEAAQARARAARGNELARLLGAEPPAANGGEQVLPDREQVTQEEAMAEARATAAALQMHEERRAERRRGAGEPANREEALRRHHERERAIFEAVERARAAAVQLQMHSGHRAGYRAGSRLYDAGIGEWAVHVHVAAHNGNCT